MNWKLLLALFFAVAILSVSAQDDQDSVDSDSESSLIDSDQVLEDEQPLVRRRRQVIGGVGGGAYAAGKKGAAAGAAGAITKGAKGAAGFKKGAKFAKGGAVAGAVSTDRRDVCISRIYLNTVPLLYNRLGRCSGIQESRRSQGRRCRWRYVLVLFVFKERYCITAGMISVSNSIWKEVR